MGFEASEASLVELDKLELMPTDSRSETDAVQEYIPARTECKHGFALLMLLNSLRDRGRVWTKRLKKAMRGPLADQYSVDGLPYSFYEPQGPSRAREPSVVTMEECEDATDPVGYLAEMAGCLDIDTEPHPRTSAPPLPMPPLYIHREGIRPRSWHGPAPKLPPIQEHNHDMQEAMILPRRLSYYSQVTV